MSDDGLAGELEEARRELAELVYAISHDVRAPLRVIDGFSEVLIEDYREELPKLAVEYLTSIRDAVARMDRLFDAVQQLNRVTQAPLRRSDVDVTALAEAIVEELRERDPSRQVQFTVEPDLHVQADPVLFRQALTHLLENAWKFTARREAVSIAVGREGAAIFVRDNGAGFDLVTAPRLFGPFQRFHPAREFEGLGIGLALVKRIAHRHAGRVWAISAPGEGTTVYMELS